MSDAFYFFPFISGAALLVEAAEMGNSDALYDLGGRLRIEVGSSSSQFKLLFLRSPLLCYCQPASFFSTWY